jgi:DNA-binding Lrp family transcriptional regulator
VNVGVRAYVLIQTEVGRAADVALRLRAIPGVVNADDVTGPYDIIAQAEAESVDDLGRIVVSRVQLIEGITRTLTCPVIQL